MNFRYCPSCGFKNEYEINLPKSCKCGLIFADAFKTKTSEIQKKVIEVIEDDGDYEIIRVKKTKKSNREKIKNIEIEANKSTAELEAEDFNDEDYDIDSKESLASQIKDTLNEDDIIVSFGGDTVEKLGQFLPKK